MTNDMPWSAPFDTGILGLNVKLITPLKVIFKDTSGKNSEMVKSF